MDKRKVRNGDMADALVTHRFAWGRSCKYVFENVGDAVWVASVWRAGMSQCLRRKRDKQC